MEMFFVALICAQGNFKDPACSAISGGYWEFIKGQRVVDKANKRYIDPLPQTAKDLGIVTYALYSRRVKFNLYRGLNCEVRVDKFDEGRHTIVSTSNLLVFSRSF